MLDQALVASLQLIEFTTTTVSFLARWAAILLTHVAEITQSMSDSANCKRKSTQARMGKEEGPPPAVRSSEPATVELSCEERTALRDVTNCKPGEVCDVQPFDDTHTYCTTHKTYLESDECCGEVTYTSSTSVRSSR